MSKYALLALASKVLYEREILELRTENERLKLSLFWKTYGPEQLYTAMQDANAHITQCKCFMCAVSGRYDLETNICACSFVPWFEKQLAKCGLESATIDDQSKHFQHESMLAWDIDTHFVHDGGLDDHWLQFSYGSKLHRATSIENPELQKLKRLFELITM
jgi:hypothetical protein